MKAQLFSDLNERAEARLTLAAALLVADVSARGLPKAHDANPDKPDRDQHARVDDALKLADVAIARAEAEYSATIP